MTAIAHPPRPTASRSQAAASATAGTPHQKTPTPVLNAGDWVEVRSKAEILQTLDRQGELDAMPFMPEMFAYCGRRFRVWRSAHKTCDTVNRTGGRTVTDSVHLEDVRCDGSGHGGCEAACLIFWKTAWLKPVSGPPRAAEVAARAAAVKSAPAASGCREEDVIAATQTNRSPEPVYACQATLLPKFTTLLPWWDVRQYVKDYTSGNATLDELFGGVTYSLFTRISRRVAGPRLRAAYDVFQRLRGGTPFPRRRGLVPQGEQTPNEKLNLQPGEIVEVKSYPEILATLDSDNKNRGLYFDAEEVLYCGQTFKVRNRVKRIVDERTGKMLVFKNESVLLEGAYCKGYYSEKRMFCPRAIYPMWREIWLKRTGKKAPATSGITAAAPAEKVI